MFNKIVMIMIIVYSMMKQLVIMNRLLEECIERNIERYKMEEEIQKILEIESKEPAYKVYKIKNITVLFYYF